MTDRQHDALNDLIGIGEVTVTPAHDEDEDYPATSVLATHALGQAVIHADGTVVTLRAARLIPHPTVGFHTAAAPVFAARGRPVGPWD